MPLRVDHRTATSGTRIPSRTGHPVTARSSGRHDRCIAWRASHTADDAEVDEGEAHVHETPPHHRSTHRRRHADRSRRRHRDGRSRRRGTPVGPRPDRPAGRHVQPLAQPQRPGPARRRPQHRHQRPGEDRGRGHPAREPRHRAAQRVRLRAGQRRGRPVPRQLPRGAAGHGRRGRVPVRVRRSVEHRHRERLRPQQQRRGRHHAPGGGLRRRRVRLRRVRGPVRHGRALEVPDRRRRGAHVPALPLEGHARRTAARRPEHRGAGRLVLARRARRVPPVEQVALGHPGRGRRQHRARARVAPDAAHVRRRRGPQRPAQPRRDPVLGRLRHAGQGLPLHLRRRRRRPAGSSPASRS